MQPLAAQYGVAAVFWRGLDALGYPPTWAHTHDEKKCVETECEKGGAK